MLEMFFAAIFMLLAIWITYDTFKGIIKQKN